MLTHFGHTTFYKRVVNLRISKLLFLKSYFGFDCLLFVSFVMNSTLISLTWWQRLDIGSSDWKFEFVALDPFEGVGGDGVHRTRDLQFLQLRAEGAENLVGQDSRSLQNSGWQCSEWSQARNDRSESEFIFFYWWPTLKLEHWIKSTLKEREQLFLCLLFIDRNFLLLFYKMYSK